MTSTVLTPQDFVQKWAASTRTERAAAQEHFIDLCRLLGQSTLNCDPTGESYAFEKGAAKAANEAVFDVYGWPDDLEAEDILRRLLALNLSCDSAS